MPRPTVCADGLSPCRCRAHVLCGETLLLIPRLKGVACDLQRGTPTLAYSLRGQRALWRARHELRLTLLCVQMVLALLAVERMSCVERRCCYFRGSKGLPVTCNVEVQLLRTLCEDSACLARFRWYKLSCAPCTCSCSWRVHARRIWILDGLSRAASAYSHVALRAKPRLVALRAVRAPCLC